MAARSTYLQLPLELGGLRFGPFNGVVTLGSDAKRSQIVLDPSHGVFPVHVTVTPLEDGSYAIAPATRDGKVFVQPAGQPHVWPITSTVQARPGDLLVVGTLAGPRFLLVQEGPLTAAPTADDVVRTARQTGGSEAGFVQGISQFGQAASGLFKPPSTKGISGEVQRRAQASALATRGPLRDLYVFWSRFRGGMLTSPYFIVGVLFAVVGVVGTGSVSCTGLLYVLLDVMGIHR